jgi:hypothetical protein
MSDALAVLGDVAHGHCSASCPELSPSVRVLMVRGY